MNRFRVLPAVLLAAFATPVSMAQWVSFTDETASRLTLSPFADDLLGNPVNDAGEKDVAVADLNLDGWDDVIVTRKLPFSVPGAKQDVLLMNENGVLVDRTATLAPGFITTLTDARDLFIGDFTGDNWPDVVIANTFAEQPRFYRNLGNNLKGTWLGLVDESSTRFPVIAVDNLAGPQYCAVWGGDVTGNGAMDIFFANYAMAFGTTDTLLINDGSGFFTDETVARLGANANVAFGTAANIVDMDNDGDKDIIKVSTLYAAPPFGIGVFILFNNGAGVFNTIAVQEPLNSSPYYLATGDLNGNGLMDIFVEQDPQDRVNLATSVTPDGPNTYSSVSLTASPRTSGFGGNTKLADIDNDGDLDVGVAPIDVDIANCGIGNEFALLQNPGNGVVIDPWPGAGSQNIHVDAHDFGFIDVNNDGCLDLFMAMCTGWQVFIQTNCAVVCVADCATPSDGLVNVTDLLQLFADWGTAGSGCDTDASGTIDVSDLLTILAQWGACP